MAQAMAELKTLFKEKYNIDLTDEEALKEMQDLLYIYAFSQGRMDLLEGCSTLSMEEAKKMKK